MPFLSYRQPRAADYWHRLMGHLLHSFRLHWAQLPVVGENREAVCIADVAMMNMLEETKVDCCCHPLHFVGHRR
jgi:hypothetical protein